MTVSTNYSKTNPNATGYAKLLHSQDLLDNLLLQSGDDLLQQNNASLILFESGQFVFSTNFGKGSVNSTNYTNT